MSVHEYVSGYQFEFDGGGSHSPSEAEKAMIEDAISGYLAAQQDVGWRPIETAPKDRKAVWLWCEGEKYIGYYEPSDWLSKGKWFLNASVQDRDGREEIFGTYAHGVEPTHWQPLPERLEQGVRETDR